ncbi:hypothetical protein KR76_19200 [Pimelobacter simplex]|uniref:Uncharacterized protein n=1 Tax=Nocardioides simplex TaxID=2045 RepID=A0A0A1DLX2_NOCSI|nr:hypothetical protein KR76_19200 [Pimelobacter simplex]
MRGWSVASYSTKNPSVAGQRGVDALVGLTRVSLSRRVRSVREAGHAWDHRTPSHGVPSKTYRGVPDGKTAVSDFRRRGAATTGRGPDPRRSSTRRRRWCVRSRCPVRRIGPAGAPTMLSPVAPATGVKRRVVSSKVPLTDPATVNEHHPGRSSARATPVTRAGQI